MCAQRDTEETKESQSNSQEIETSATSVHVCMEATTSDRLRQHHNLTRADQNASWFVQGNENVNWNFEILPLVYRCLSRTFHYFQYSCTCVVCDEQRPLSKGHSLVRGFESSLYSLKWSHMTFTQGRRDTRQYTLLLDSTTHHLNVESTMSYVWNFLRIKK